MKRSKHAKNEARSLSKRQPEKPCNNAAIEAENFEFLTRESYRGGRNEQYLFGEITSLLIKNWMSK